MVLPRQWWLVWLALCLCCAGPGWASASTREQRAFDQAASAFHDGLWPLAEMDFAQFDLKYPESKRLPEAGLLQARAMIKEGKYILAEELLTARKPQNGPLADDYTYWLGEAQYQSGNWQGAAATLASLPPGSPRALPATVEAGAALAKLEDWSQLLAFFDSKQGLFSAAVQTDPDNELVLRSRLLQAQARYARREFEEAGRLLSNFKPATLPPDLEWQRIYLLCQVKLAEGNREAALPLATELVRLAQGGNSGSRLAAAAALQARVLEELGRIPEAMAAWQVNLATNVPPEPQREAILKIATLAIAQKQFTNAESVLEDFATRFTNSPALDVAWLTLGELNLQAYLGQPDLTNRLADARARFDQLINFLPNSSIVGKAYLDRGWCGWLATNYADSLADFKNATLKLPPSEDLAVARFKLADALFAQGDYADALNNYTAVLANLTNNFPRLAQALGDRARYQSFRAQIQMGNLAEAEQTMNQLAADYPLSALNDSTAFLLGQGYTDMSAPTNALAWFQVFKEKLPHSPLMPAVDLALARASEEAANWPAALAQYDYWLATYPTNALLPQAMYSQAWANYQAGNETNALVLFTNFVARFPLHELAPTAQMWVADHYFRLGDSVNAERNYKAIFQNTNWLFNALYYPAQIMAGRAAMARTDNLSAIRDYFEKLEADTNCPQDLRVQATFAHGSALMKMESPDTNNPTANFLAAITVFTNICISFPTNELGARAWGEIGDCYLQVTNYESATNAYLQAVNAAGTNYSIYSQARIGLGLVQEKQAALLPAGDGRKTLLYQALGNYLEVFNADDPGRDPFWTKKAGLLAADLAGNLEEWREAINIYSNLATQLPQLKESLAKKTEAARLHLTTATQ